MMSHFYELTKKMIETRQRSASLEQDAKQPRLFTEAHVTSNKNTCKRMEYVVAERVISGDSCSAKSLQADPTSSTSFSMKAEPLALPRSNDVLVDKGAAASKPCLSPAEMGTRTADGGSLPAGTASTALGTIFSRLLFSWSLGETKKRTNRIKNQLASFWRRVIQTKSRQTLVFDPGGSSGRLRACPFWGAWRALLCVKVIVWAPDGIRGRSVFGRRLTSEYHFPERRTSGTYVLRSIAVSCSQAGLNIPCRQSLSARGYVSCEGEQMSGNAMERGV